MTVIAYRDGVMASDSLMICGSTKSGTARKIVKVAGHLFGMAGVIHELDAFVTAVLRGDTYAPQDSEYDALCVTPDGVVWHYHGKIGTAGIRIDNKFHAIGSGTDVAIGAMEMGATPEEAVRAAIKHNTGCGGKVRKIEL